jgi:hypothetical protein
MNLILRHNGQCVAKSPAIFSALRQAHEKVVIYRGSEKAYQWRASRRESQDIHFAVMRDPGARMETSFLGVEIVIYEPENEDARVA